MQNESQGAVPASVPSVVIVGATRSQLRSFGLTIERAGYHAMVIEADRNVVENLSAQQADILAYNLEMGYTAILRGFRALPQQPALILLDGERALPADGFALSEQTYHTPDALEALLRQRLAPVQQPPVSDDSAPVAAAPLEVGTGAADNDERLTATPAIQEPVTAVQPSAPAPGPISSPPVAPAQRVVRPQTVIPPVITPPADERTSRDEIPRVRRRAPVQRRQRLPSIVWQTALVVAAALLVMWGISASDALRPDPAANPAEAARPTNDTPADPEATETALIAPEVDSQAPPAPNLVARIIEVTPAEPTSSEIVNVRVLVENTGTAPAQEDFWVDLYVSPETTPAANQAWPDITDPSSGQGATWLVEGLEAGDEIVLDSLQADPTRSNLLRFAEGGPVELYVYVDSYGSTPSGAVVEQSENNNLFGPFELFVGD
jgi:hypothetical protein